MRCKTRIAFVLIAGFLVAHGGAAQEPARPLRYRIEMAGSSLRWELPATLHTVRGVVPRFEGSISADPLPEGGWDVRGRIVVPAASMRTGNEKRDRTMREKVLETDRYPEIVFELTRFTGDLSRFRPGQTFPVQVSGKLTIHGKTTEVQLPVDVHVFDGYAVLTGSFPINWKELGLADPSFGFIKVKEPLQVLFRLRAVRAAATSATGDRFKPLPGYNQRF